MWPMLTVWKCHHTHLCMFSVKERTVIVKVAFQVCDTYWDAYWIPMILNIESTSNDQYHILSKMQNNVEPYDRPWGSIYPWDKIEIDACQKDIQEHHFGNKGYKDRICWIAILHTTWNRCILEGAIRRYYPSVKWESAKALLLNLGRTDVVGPKDGTTRSQ